MSTAQHRSLPARVKPPPSPVPPVGRRARRAGSWSSLRHCPPVLASAETPAPSGRRGIRTRALQGPVPRQKWVTAGGKRLVPLGFAHRLRRIASRSGSMRHEAPVQMASSQDSRYVQKDTVDQNFDYMFKLLIIGNSSVGKTSFLFRYADDSFTSAFVSTVGIDFKVKTVFRNEKRIKLQIWDTAGQERYRTITTAYYRGAMGFILMYDITNEESFNAVQDWSTQIKTYSWDNAQVILVGNKCDMEDERIVSMERGKQLADQLGFEFFETSAKDNINVKQTFERLVDIICEKMLESLATDPTVAAGKQNTKLTENPPPQQQNCGC
ncbi:ras-related protein Rab-3C isoform X2 [Narcine bancroftii]